MEKELTPMELLRQNINIILYRIDNYEDVKDDILKEIQYHLPKEQAAIKEAYKNGYISKDWHETPTEYFTNKYNSNE